MQQLTVRGFEPELADRIRRLAQQERISLNQAVLRLLRRGAGLDTDQAGDDTVGASLDHFIGSWTGRQADEMDRALADFELRGGDRGTALRVSARFAAGSESARTR